MENRDLIPVNNEERAVANQFTFDDDNSFIADLTAPRTQAYSSIDLLKTSEKEKIAYFNAINSSDKRLGDKINEVIELKNVYVEIVQLKNEVTGEMQDAPRIVLIDSKGEGYTCVSTGVFSSLKKVFQVFGMPPTWSSPKKVKIKQVTKGEKKILTLAISE
ncbi:hypothetical protein [Clostridium beijerinckii]|uniref:hypothetical protein n=1 Tax=Clostridium beijerinckii TaxID=1520 RepID=UPI00098CE9C4|nr:hypothetical protein [Clostridium beijerinckii]MBA8937719.1 hypothetical protein [Clostridium beijerinckii]NSA95115.1 hypothetical protein [Clostridium beijerinckii]OOM49405.1 hypothetical protein CLBKI_50040 [Clostridium beijerinckii]OOM66991.1 hypothetical protein CLOBI_04780 [Clostridium beijerinckii]CUU51217.1 conserved protein of unknown function [Clostridium beijerinckii]